MTEKDLIKESFLYLNSYKRHRALANIRRMEGDRDQANFHQLKAYQLIDSLELALRAVQKGLRDYEDEKASDETEVEEN